MERTTRSRSSGFRKTYIWRYGWVPFAIIILLVSSWTVPLSLGAPYQNPVDMAEGFDNTVTEPEREETQIMGILDDYDIPHPGVVEDLDLFVRNQNSSEVLESEFLADGWDNTTIDLDPVGPSRQLENLPLARNRLSSDLYMDAPLDPQNPVQSMEGMGSRTAQDETGYQEPAPVQDFRDFQESCDLNDDGSRDMVTHDWISQKSDIVAISGDTGETLWSHDNHRYTQMPAIIVPQWGYPAPIRPGDPMPIYPFSPPPTLETGPDLTDDGVCDFLAYGFDWEMVMIPIGVSGFLMFAEFQGSLRMINGVDGETEWSIPINASYTHAYLADPNGNDLFESYEMEGFPTGMEISDEEGDPRFVFKTTDINWKFVGIVGLAYVQIDEHILLGDSKTGDAIWERTITNNNFVGVWVTGMNEVTGDGEPDVILDDSVFEVRALQGAPNMEGEDIYQMSYLNEGQSGELSFEEEDCRVPLWPRASIVGDVTDDGHPDIVAQYLSIPCPPFDLERESAQGIFRTHFTPVDGQAGTRMWPGLDTQIQGWGFATDLNTDAGTSNPLIAFGMVDLSLTVPGGRFPDMEIRMSVHHSETGAPQWSFSEQMALDDTLAQELALRHYQETLAPLDMDDDGVRDILTPSMYRSFVHQGLVSLAEHDYEILNGRSGQTLSEFSAWGMVGNVVPCEESDNEITIVAGHARRRDVSRIDADTGETIWRTPVYNNPVHVSQTAGRSVLYNDSACVPIDDNRTGLGMNTGVDSLQRGYEVLNVYGAIYRDNASTAWLDPELPWVPSLEWHSGQLVVQTTGPGTAATAAYTLLPILPGIALGGLWGYYRYRKPKPEVLS